MRSIIFTIIFCTLFVWAVTSKGDTAIAEVTGNAQATASKFALLTFVNAANFTFIRYNTTTGESYVSNGEVWAKIQDTVRIPTGQYELQTILSGTTFRSLVRIEKNSGRVWYGTASATQPWYEMKDPDPTAARSPGATPAPAPTKTP